MQAPLGTLSLCVSSVAYQPQQADRGPGCTVGLCQNSSSLSDRTLTPATSHTVTWAGSGSGKRQWRCSQNVVVVLWDSLFGVLSLACPGADRLFPGGKKKKKKKERKKKMKCGCCYTQFGNLTETSFFHMASLCSSF